MVLKAWCWVPPGRSCAKVENLFRGDPRVVVRMLKPVSRISQQIVQG